MTKSKLLQCSERRLKKLTETQPELLRAERLVSEAAKIYRLDLPCPTALQANLDEAAKLLGDLVRLQSSGT